MTNAITERFVPAVTAILAVVSGYSAWKIGALDEQLKRQELEIRGSSEDRAREQSLRELNFKIYEAVREALSDDKGGPKRQEVARALVTEMAREPFKTGLLAVLTNSSDTHPEVRKAAAFDLEDASRKAVDAGLMASASNATPAPPALSSPWSNWDFDFFWCETSGERGQRLAEAALKVKGSGSGRWRVRMLPATVNERPGYQIHGYVIKPNDKEDEMAQKLKAAIEKAVPDTRFEMQRSRQATPFYLSAFFCPG
jgi:hypothetical protein